MKRLSQTIFVTAFFTICLLFTMSQSVFSECSSMQGVKSVKAVFDFELGNPQSALMHLQVIQQTFKDKDMWIKNNAPDIVVIFIGPSVKLVSTNRSGFSPDDQKILDQIAKKISEMAKDGIKFEICLIAAKFLGVEPSSILPEVKPVNNGWVSLIGYEASGYSLVPVSP